MTKPTIRYLPLVARSGWLQGARLQWAVLAEALLVTLLITVFVMLPAGRIAWRVAEGFPHLPTYIVLPVFMLIPWVILTSLVLPSYFPYFRNR
ncbi:hypothetical protein, partial [Thermaurantiacus sp.]